MIVQLAVFGASLLSILCIAALARWLQLGGDLRIRDVEDARRLAREADPDFAPVDVALDKGGMGALLRDADGRYLLLRRHGTHFFGRILDDHSQCRLDRNALIIGTGDRFDTPINLNLGPAAQVWAARFRDMRGGKYA